MLKYIDYAYAVYRERSFTRAAEKLYISQPALSLTIKKLETELGGPVFDRSGREITLTPLGEKYIRAAEAVMDIREELRRGMDDLLELRSGHVAVACPSVVSSHVLPWLIRDFRQQYPNVEFEVLVREDASQALLAEQNAVDIAIDGAAARIPQVEYVPFFEERVLLAVPAERAVNRRLRHLQLPSQAVLSGTLDYAAAPRAELRDFAAEEFILLREPNPLAAHTHALLLDHGVWPRAVMQFEHVITALNYAECGFGCCFTTDLALRYKARADTLALYLPQGQETVRQVYLMHNKSRYLSAAARAFIRFAVSRTAAEAHNI